ncbi:MAG: hypothetical protein KC636_12955 [Myxococcales bacterium]|nr:hypothetical protein [Myxococcales bacterium]
MNTPINPYIAGNAVGNTRAFVGRRAILHEVLQLVRHPERGAMILYGQRRIGKTSILTELEARLPTLGPYLCVYFDLQGYEKADVAQIEADIIDAVVDALDERVDGARPHLAELCEGGLLAQRTLVLLFDEFESLADARDFIDYLRALTEQQRKLKLIFTVGRSISELPSLAMAMFKGFPFVQISLMSRDEHDEIVRLCEANEAATLRWEDAAVDELWALTAGHAYLTQQLCSILWEQAYRHAPSAPPQVTRAQVIDAAPKAIERSTAMFEWLWCGLTPPCKITVAAVAAAPGQRVSDESIYRMLYRYGVARNELRVATALLNDWDILESGDTATYFIRVELLRRWIKRYRPLAVVSDELDRVDPHADAFYRAARDGRAHQGVSDRAALCREALERNPNHTGASELLARILREQGRYGEAAEILRRQHEIKPAIVGDALVSVLLEWAATVPEAERIPLYKEAADIDPRSDANKRLVEACYSQAGKMMARREFRAARELYRMLGEDDKAAVADAKGQARRRARLLVATLALPVLLIIAGSIIVLRLLEREGAATIEAARPPAEAPALCEACAAPEEATPREALYGPMLDFILDELQATKLLRQGESHVDSAAQRFLVDLRAELLRDLEGIMTERSQAFNTDDTAALIVDQYLVSGAPITPLKDGKAEWYAVKINVFTPRARGRAAAFELYSSSSADGDRDTPTTACLGISGDARWVMNCGIRGSDSDAGFDSELFECTRGDWRRPQALAGQGEGGQDENAERVVCMTLYREEQVRPLSWWNLYPVEWCDRRQRGRVAVGISGDASLLRLPIVIPSVATPALKDGARPALRRFLVPGEEPLRLHPDRRAADEFATLAAMFRESDDPDLTRFQAHLGRAMDSLYERRAEQQPPGSLTFFAPPDDAGLCSRDDPTSSRAPGAVSYHIFTYRSTDVAWRDPSNDLKAIDAETWKLGALPPPIRRVFQDSNHNMFFTRIEGLLERLDQPPPANATPDPLRAAEDDDDRPDLEHARWTYWTADKGEGGRSDVAFQRFGAVATKLVEDTSRSRFPDHRDDDRALGEILGVDPAAGAQLRVTAVRARAEQDGAAYELIFPAGAPERPLLQSSEFAARSPERLIPPVAAGWACGLTGFDDASQTRTFWCVRDGLTLAVDFHLAVLAERSLNG